MSIWKGLKGEKEGENGRVGGKYPVEELAKNVGHVIEVYYLARGDEKIERAYLKKHPTEERFYIGDGEGYHIVKWYETKEDAVKSIKDRNWNEIYRNDNIDFDHEKAKDITRSELEPSGQDKRYSNN